MNSDIERQFLEVQQRVLAQMPDQDQQRKALEHAESERKPRPAPDAGELAAITELHWSQRPDVLAAKQADRDAEERALYSGKDADYLMDRYGAGEAPADIPADETPRQKRQREQRELRATIREARRTYPTLTRRAALTVVGPATVRAQPHTGGRGRPRG